MERERVIAIKIILVTVVSLICFAWKKNTVILFLFIAKIIKNILNDNDIFKNMRNSSF